MRMSQNQSSSLITCPKMCPHRQKQRDQSESRASAQRGELSVVRETHQQVEVERQLLEREKAQLSESLARVRKRQLVLIKLVQLCFLWPLYDAHCTSRLRAVTQSSLCCSTSCSQRIQLSGTLWLRWRAWMRAWPRTKFTWTPTFSRWGHVKNVLVLWKGSVCMKGTSLYDKLMQWILQIGRRVHTSHSLKDIDDAVFG